MSYDIALRDPVTCAILELDNPHQIKGGTYALNGTNEAWLNVTFNYARWYHRKGVFPLKNGENQGIRTIYGLSGAESIPILKAAIEALEGITDEFLTEKCKEYEDQGIDGYWLPTRENAIKPLYSLLAFAQMRPDGIWDGD